MNVYDTDHMRLEMQQNNWFALTPQERWKLIWVKARLGLRPKAHYMRPLYDTAKDLFDTRV